LQKGGKVVAEDRDIVLLQGLRNSLMAASVIGSSALFAMMGWIAVVVNKGGAWWVGLPAVASLAIAMLAVSGLAHGSALADQRAIERRWHFANALIAVAALLLVLFPVFLLLQIKVS
jgi:hypothetical protein